MPVVFVLPILFILLVAAVVVLFILIKKLWATLSLPTQPKIPRDAPTPEAFSATLISRYLEAAKPHNLRVLRTHDIKPVVRRYQFWYEHFFRPEADKIARNQKVIENFHEALKQYSDACFASLQSFTYRLPRDLTIAHDKINTASPQKGLFKVPQCFSHFCVKDETWDINDDFRQAYRGLVSTFDSYNLKNVGIDWTSSNFMTIMRGVLRPIPPTGPPYDKEDFDRFNKQADQYNKEFKQREKNATQIDLITSGSPFYQSEPRINEVVTPFVLPDDLRFWGHWIVAPPGRGKTTLLQTLCLQDLTAVQNNAASIIILDAKGELSDWVKTLKVFAPGQPLADRLVYLEPNEQYPLALNPLDLGASLTHTASFVEYIFSALTEAATTKLQSTLLLSVLPLLAKVDGASFSKLREVLLDGYEPYLDQIQHLHREDRDFFLKGEFDSDTYANTRKELLWRIRNLTIRVPLLREMFYAPKTRINIAEMMDTAKVVVINNSWKLLSEEGCEFLGRFFIALVRAAADQRSNRPPDQKLPVYFYIDECQGVIAKDLKLAGIINECRSQNIAMILAHQKLLNIKEPLVLSTLADCGIRFVNVDDDARSLAPTLKAKPEELTRDKRGEFWTYMSGKGTAVVQVMPYAEPEHMTESEFQNIRHQMIADYSIEPPRVEQSSDVPKVEAIRNHPAYAPSPQLPSQPIADRPKREKGW